MSVKIEKSPIINERFFSKALMQQERSDLLEKIKNRKTDKLYVSTRISEINSLIENKIKNIEDLTAGIDLINQDILILQNEFEQKRKEEMKLKNVLYSKFLKLFDKESELEQSSDELTEKISKKESELNEKRKIEEENKIELQILREEINILDTNLSRIEEESSMFKNDFFNFLDTRKKYFQQYKPIIDILFDKFKKNDFDKENLDEIKKEIAELKLKNEINEEIEKYLNSYIDNLKSRNVEKVAKENAVVFVHAINNGTTEGNSNLKLKNDRDFASGETWKKKIDIILSITPNISTSTIKYGDTNLNIFGSRFGVIVSNGFIDIAESTDSTTVSNSLYGSKNKATKETYAGSFFTQENSEHVKLAIELEKKESDINSLDIDNSINNRVKTSSGVGSYNELTIQNPKLSGFFICTNNININGDTRERLTLKELEESNKIPKIHEIYLYQERGVQLYEMYNGLFYKIKIVKEGGNFIVESEKEPVDPNETSITMSKEERELKRKSLLSSGAIDPKRIGDIKMKEEKDLIDIYVKGWDNNISDFIINSYWKYMDFLFSGDTLEPDMNKVDVLFEDIGLSFYSEEIKNYIKEEKIKNPGMEYQEFYNLIKNSKKLNKFSYDKKIELINRRLIKLKTLTKDESSVNPDYNPFFLKAFILKNNINISDLSMESQEFLEKMFKEYRVDDILNRRLGENNSFIINPEEIELT